MPDWIIFVLVQLYNQICNTSALYFFLLCTTKLCIPMGGTRLFLSFLFVLVQMLSSPAASHPNKSLPDSGTKSRFLFAFTQFAYEIHFSILGGKLFFISPYLIFSPLSYSNPLDPRAYKLNLTQCKGILVWRYRWDNKYIGNASASDGREIEFWFNRIFICIYIYAIYYRLKYR